jgi:NADPH:quinone reductase
MSIQALIVDPAASNAIRMAEVAEPAAGPTTALIQVRHLSLNHGDLNDARSGRIRPGGILGSDAAGVVAEAAHDQSGPQVGARVVGLAQGAFAERIAVGVHSLAEVPESVDLAEAAALPVAGLAALRALRAAGPLLGRRVLITGASGEVGGLAVQLAAHAGAHVVASVGSVARGQGLAERGAGEVVVGLDGLDRPVDVVLENVGGPQLVAAWRLLAPGGSLQSIGWASGEPAVFPPLFDDRPRQNHLLVPQRGRRLRGSVDPRWHAGGPFAQRRDRVARAVGAVHRGCRNHPGAAADWQGGPRYRHLIVVRLCQAPIRKPYAPAFGTEGSNRVPLSWTNPRRQARSSGRWRQSDRR